MGKKDQAEPPPARKPQYWVLKTTEGPGGSSHWEDFQDERVVAVGWPAVKKDPRSFPDPGKYREALGASRRSEAHAADTIWSFVNDWQTNDVAIICVGYAPNQSKDVYVYGCARVNGPPRRDLESDWWVFKRPAQIWPIEKSVPVKVFRRVFGGSMLLTTHGPFSQDQFGAFRNQVEALYPRVFRGLCLSAKAPAPSENAAPRERQDGFAFPEEIERATAAALHEGAKYLVYVNAYERSRLARQRCIAHHGKRCSICDLSFADAYGPIAERIIHVHHLRKLSEIGRKYEIDPVVDLRPICPNCHAVVHLNKKPLTIEQVKTLIEKARGRSR